MDSINFNYIILRILDENKIKLHQTHQIRNVSNVLPLHSSTNKYVNVSKLKKLVRIMLGLG